MVDEKALVLVDGSSYLFRAYHAMGPLSSSAGEPTGAILGVMNMLRKLLDTYSNNPLVMIFDAPGKTFRHDVYPAYKANRPPAPDDLVTQIGPLHDIVRALGLPLICESGVEADDVIGTLATQAEQAGMDSIIISSDKDMTQLVNDHVIMIDTMKDKVMDAAAVVQKFGVPPKQMIDFLALVGDTADNVPGVPKVGPKTATKWLTQYPNIEQIMANADGFKGKVGESLRASLTQLPLSKDLVTIKRDVPLPRAVTDLHQTERDLDTLEALCVRFGFRQWQQTITQWRESASMPSPEAVELDYHTLYTKADFTAWLTELKAADLFAFDTETTSLTASQAELVGVSFCCTVGRAAYVPLAHEDAGAAKQLDRDWVLSQLKPLLENPNSIKVAHNLKYDQTVLLRYGIVVAGTWFDTMLESYIYRSVGTRHNMDTLASKYLDMQTTHYEDVAGKGVKQIPFNQVPIAIASPYAAEDADVTLRLHHFFWPKLTEVDALKALVLEVEMPMVSVLARMEATGVYIDTSQLHQQSSELAEGIQRIEATAHELAGESFNLGSPKQVQHILFEKQGLPILEKTAKKQPSTSESALKTLALDHPLPKAILEYRKMSKLKSTYTDSLPKQVNPKTLRVHTSYNQAVAETGRLSSSAPNLQNIPIRTAEGRRIRQAFIARPGYKILAADYSQIELRIMAHLSGDETLLAAFAHGEDIHRSTAAQVFSVEVDAVTTIQRRSAKAINFGLMYGQSAFGLAKELGLTKTAAQQYIDQYFARYPKAYAFIEGLKLHARKEGMVETLFGRRWYLPNILSRNFQTRAHDERTAINAPMQGTAADIIKKAMITIDHWICHSGLPIYMIMQVHDELVFEIQEDIIEQVLPTIRQMMGAAADLKVSLDVDIGVGNNWDEAH